MDVVLRIIGLVVFYAAFIDLLRRISRSYPTRRDVVLSGVDGALFALAGGVLVEAAVATTLGWVVVCGGGFALMLDVQRDPADEGKPEPSTTSEVGNKIALVAGIVIAGLLLFAAVVMEGWVSLLWLVVAALLVARLGMSGRKARTTS